MPDLAQQKYMLETPIRAGLGSNTNTFFLKNQIKYLLNFYTNTNTFYQIQIQYININQSNIKS